MYWACALLRVCLTGPLSATIDADETAFSWLKKAVKAANLGTRFWDPAAYPQGPCPRLGTREWLCIYGGWLEVLGQGAAPTRPSLGLSPSIQPAPFCLFLLLLFFFFGYYWALY